MYIRIWQTVGCLYEIYNTSNLIRYSTSVTANTQLDYSITLDSIMTQVKT